MRVLNVGSGGNRNLLPPMFAGWEQVLLDIDPNVQPDIVCDARELKKLEGSQFDAVHCSHYLEHFYQPEVPVVLEGFKHVLKTDGLVNIIVPDVAAAMRDMIARDHDINDVWYRTPTGPVTFHDVLYGWGPALQIGNYHYSHRCGFTRLALESFLHYAGFGVINIELTNKNMDLHARGRKP